MSAISTHASVGTLSGTPVLWLPVPTPWPSASGCEKYLYRAVMEVTMLAYDPLRAPEAYPEASSCFVPQHTAWRWQDPNKSPSTVLGPTFVCPESWSAVHSTVLTSNSAAETQFTYCCPPDYTLAALQPPSDRFYIQCTSTAEPGVTVPYQTYIGTEVPKAGGGEDEVEVILTHTSTETVVESSPLTVYAFPVNGYNIITSEADSSTSTHDGTLLLTTSTGDGPAQTDGATADDGSGSSSSEDGLSSGAIAGVVVGAVLGLALMALIAFFIWRKYPRSAASKPTDQEKPEPTPAATGWGAAATAGGAGVGVGEGGGGGGGQPINEYYAYQKPPQPYVSEAPVERYAHELPPSGVYAYELPVNPR